MLIRPATPGCSAIESTQPSDENSESIAAGLSSVRCKLWIALRLPGDQNWGDWTSSRITVDSPEGVWPVITLRTAGNGDWELSAVVLDIVEEKSRELTKIKTTKLYENGHRELRSLASRCGNHPQCVNRSVINTSMPTRMR